MDNSLFNMTKKITLMLIILSSFSCKRQNKISYKIIHNLKDSIPELNIEMQFKANNSEETILVIKNEAWGQSDLFKTISDIKSDQALEIRKQRDSGWIVIKHKKGVKNITLSYTLKQDFKGPFVYTKFYRPIIQDTYFHLLSHSTFMLPIEYVSNVDKSIDIYLEWGNYGDNYNIVNSFGSNTKIQKIKNIQAKKFHHAIFTGGDYKTFNLNINNKEIVFSTRGDWETIKDIEVANYLKQTIQIQRDFWKDHTQNYFAVIMTPSYLKEGSALQGTRIFNSFATGVSNNKFLKKDELIKLFNHELMHNWIGGTIANESEEQYWFSEGFTEYLALKNIAKNEIGGLDESYFIDEINGYLQRLSSSSAREVPNKDIMIHYWDDFEYNRLPYRRGVIFAFYLDNKIQQDSKGAYNLTDFMLELKKHAINNNQKTTHTHFISIANTFLKDDLTPFFNKHIEKGSLFNFPKMFKDFKYDFNEVGTVFDLGFTFVDKSEKNIGSINKNSNAYKVGLRKGDRIVGQSYIPGNPSQEASVKVLKGNKKVLYKFSPSRKAPLVSLLNNLKNKKKILQLAKKAK